MSATAETATRTALTQLLAAVQGPEPKDVFTWLLNTHPGPDQYKRKLNSQLMTDYEQGLKVVEEVKGYLARTGGAFQVGEYLTSEEAEGTWHAWEVIFPEKEDRFRRYFGFLQMPDGTYGLGDIDKG